MKRSAIFAAVILLAFAQASLAQTPPDEFKLVPSDGDLNDIFGISVSISDDVAIVGARLDDDNGTNSGSAYVFRLVGGSWVEEAKILASIGSTANFGHSVSISDGVAIVGAPLDDDGGTNSGSAYVFRLVGGSWVEEAKLLASDGDASDIFGHSVLISEDVAVVGAPENDDNGSRSGSAYVFRLVGGSWVEEAKLLAGDSEAGDEFGRSVSMTGDVVIVGSPFDDDTGTNSGSAYVFRHVAGSWVEEQKLTANDGSAGDSFGNSASISGDVVIVGSQSDDDKGTTSGSAYVFRHIGGSWNEETKLTANDGSAGDNFGISVAVDGDVAIVGAHFDDDKGLRSGSAYVFRLVGGNWDEQAKLTASDVASHDNFGSSVSIGGNIAIVGSPSNIGSGSRSGSAYIYDFTPVPVPAITSFNPTSATVGASVTIDGVNFDPIAANNTVYFGATKATVTSASTTSLTVEVPAGATHARVTVLVNSLTAFSTEHFLPTFPGIAQIINSSTLAPRVDFPGGSAWQYLATGDFDGDGHPDLAVPVPGQILVYRNTGSGGTLGTNSFDAAVTFPSPITIQKLEVGDMDGDGRLDMLGVHNGSGISVYQNVSVSSTIDFAAAVNFPTPSGSQDVAIADFDDDGRTDFAVVSYQSDRLTLFRNTGSVGVIDATSFTEAAQFSTGDMPTALIAADLDGDELPDLAVSYDSFNLFSVFRNIGSQTLDNAAFTRHDFDSPGQSWTIAAADLDGDDAVDLVIPSRTTNILSIMRNTSSVNSVSFQRQDFTGIAGSFEVAIGDLDGDGSPDLAVANNSIPVVSVYKNLGTGDFSAGRVDFASVNQGNRGIAIVDLNGDDKPDIASVSVGSQSLSLFENVADLPVADAGPDQETLLGQTVQLDGSGSTNAVTYSWTVVDQPAGSFAFLSGPLSVNPSFMPDVQGDYVIQLVVNNNIVDSDPDEVRITVVAVPTISGISPSSGVVGAPITIDGAHFDPDPDNNTVYFGATEATVTAASPTSLTVDVPSGATFGPVSVNVGGRTAISDQFFIPTFPSLGPPAAITTSSFAARVDFSTGTLPQGVVIADFDGRGKPDIAVSNLQGVTPLSIYQNQTAHTIDASSFIPLAAVPAGINPDGMAAGDVDGDGMLDIVTANNAGGSSKVSVFRNNSSNGSMTFEDPRTFDVGITPVQVALGDLNRDGRLDIVATNNSSAFVSVLENTSVPQSVSFLPQVPLPAAPRPRGVAIGDLNDDGWPDIAVGNDKDHNVVVYQNKKMTGRITGASFEQSPSSPFSTGLVTFMVVIGDLDGDGLLDLATSNQGGAAASQSVSLLMNDEDNPGSFKPHVPLSGGSLPVGLALGDLDGDGDLDIAMGNRPSNQVLVWQNKSTMGAFNFSAPAFLTAATGPDYVAIGDLDGDGSPEIVATNRTSSRLSVFHNLIAHPPDADAGPDQTVLEGLTVQLDGSGSGDPNSNTLSYDWSFIQDPASSTNLTGSNTVSPSFVPDVPGDYIVRLIVNDGTSDSDPDEVTITAHPAPPASEKFVMYHSPTGIVRRWTNTGQFEENVQLASDWHDLEVAINGDLVMYHSPTGIVRRWTRTGQQLGSVTLPSSWHDLEIAANGDLVMYHSPTGIVRRWTRTGQQLGSVTLPSSWHDLEIAANGDLVMYHSPTGIVRRWTSAGQQLGDVTLASDWHDLEIGANEDFLQYHSPTGIVRRWTSTGQQLGSVDVTLASDWHDLEIRSDDPVAVAAAVPSDALIGETVTLDGSASFHLDPNKNVVDYDWTLRSQPSGSLATLSNSGTSQASLIPDKPGDYVVQLVVNDGTFDSFPDEVTITAVTCVEPSAGLVSWWKGDGTSKDAGGTRDGTLQNGATFTSGRVGQAFSLDGVDDFISIPSSGLVTYPGAWSIEAWVQTTDVVNVRYVLQLWNTAESGGALASIGVLNGNLMTTQSGDNVNAGFIADGFLHHVAVTFDGTTHRLYKDGVEVGSKAMFTQSAPVEVALIGKGTAGSHWQGSIDELSFYHQALTVSQIQAIYDASVAGKCVLPVAVVAAVPSEVLVGKSVPLDGSASFHPDPNENVVGYDWTLPIQPSGSLATLSNSGTSQASLIPDKPGDYVVQLVVNDGTFDSFPDEVTITAVTCVEPSAGLVSWWKGDGTSKDAGGTRDGTLQNGATFTSGRVAQAFSLDGVDDFISIPSSGLVTYPGAWSMEAWVQTTDVVNERYVLQLWNIANSGGALASMGVLNGNLMTTQAGDNVNAGFIADGLLHHVAVTFDGTTHRLYKDGVEVGSKAMFTQSAPVEVALIGKSTAGNHWQGSIDELSFYHQALTAIQIQAIYEASVAGKCAPILTADARVLAFGDEFDTVASSAFGNESGTWSVLTSGKYRAEIPDNAPVARSSLPFELDDFAVEFDFNPLNGGGGLLLRGVEAPGNIGVSGVDFAGARDASGSGRLFWHIIQNDSFGPALAEVSGLFTPGDNIHIRVTVDGDTYSAYLNGSTTPATTLTTSTFNSGRFYLLDNDALMAFDNVELFTSSREVVVGDEVQLDGGGSVDPNGDGLAYQWNIVSQPSSVTLLNDTAEAPTFIPDLPGEYVVELVVSDATSSSDPDQVTVTATECVLPQPTVVSWWTGEDDGSGAAQDLAGGNTGSPQNGVEFVPGHVGGAMRFDGVDDRVVVSDSPNLNVAGPFSIEAWFKAAKTDPNPSAYTIVDKSHGFGSAPTGWALTVTGTRVSFAFGDGSSILSPATDLSINVVDNRWHHVVGVFTGSSVEVYLDGVPSAIPAAATQHATNGGDLYIGAFWGGGTPARHFLGEIDEVTYYGGALSSPQISDIYNAGVAGKCPNAVPVAVADSDAGSDPTIPLGQTILLDGSGSFDPDNDPLTFSWTITQRPPGSTASPVVQTADKTNFTSDVAGVYVAKLIVNDGTSDSVPDEITITVIPVNDAPSFTLGGDQNVLEDAGDQTVGAFATDISSGPPDEAGQTLTFDVTNDNNSLFAVQPAIDPATGDLSYTPAGDASGSAIVTVVLRDDGGTDNGGVDTSPSQTFTITVAPVNDAPSFAGTSDQTVLEDAGAQTAAGFATSISAGPADEVTQTLTFDVTNDDNTLFAIQPAIDSASGDLTYTPADDANGGATVTVVLTDNGGTANGGVDTSPSVTFTITLTPVNDAPTLTLAGDQTEFEDAGAQSVAGFATTSAGPANESEQTLTMLVTNDNNALFAVQPAIDLTTGALTYTPADDGNGIATVTVALSDDGGTANGGVDAAPQQTFTITVTSVNDAPSFAGGSDQTVLEDAVAQTVAVFFTNITAGPSDEAGQTLTFDVTNDDNTLFAVQPAINPATGELTYTPADDANGGATVTVVLRDDGGTANGGVDASPPVTFDLTITPVNDAPTLALAGDQAVLEDAGPQSVAVFATTSAGPTNESGQTLTLVVTNDDNSLFAVQPAIDLATGDLTYDAAPDANGIATVTVALSDDGGTANGGVDAAPQQTFTITLTPVNDAPSFAGGPDQSVLEDAVAQSVAGFATSISAGPSDEAGQTLTFDVTNDDNSLFATQPAINAATGDLTYTPADDAYGTTTVTVVLRDDVGTANGGVDASPSVTFDLTITPVNDAPTLTLAGDQTVLEDAGPQSVASFATTSAGPANESGQTLTLLVTNDDNSLFAVQPAIDLATGDLTYDAAPDANGSTTVTVALSDDGGTANGGVDTAPQQTFTITVTPVNDAPSFAAGGDQTALEDAGAQTVAGFATSITAGPPDEAAQTLTFDVTNDDNSLFIVQPAIDPATGDLTYTPADDGNGGATVTIELRDDGGTADGGVDQSPAQTFTITVDPVNDAPSFAAGGDQTVLEDAGPQSVAGFAANLSAGPPDESGQTLSFEITHDNNLLFALGPDIDASGTLTYTPADNANGSATVNVELRDDGGSANGGIDLSAPQVFTITVESVNDLPVAVLVVPAAISEGAAATFVASGTTDIDGTIVLYTWDFGDGTAAVLTTVPTVTHTFEDNGTPVVSLTVKDNEDGEDQVTKQVTVDNAPPAVSIDPILDLILVGVPFDFSGTFDDPGVLDTHTGLWNFGDGITDAGTIIEAGGSGIAQAVHTYADPGTFTLTLTVSDEDDSGSESVAVEVLSPAAAGTELMTQVDELSAPEGTKNSLNSKLDGAFKSLDKGKPETAINQMNAFINSVNAQSGKKISVEEADALIALAQTIVASIEAENPPASKPVAAKRALTGYASGHSETYEFGLGQNYPNPFNPITAIRYSLAEASSVRLTIYNLLGQEVRVLVNETQNPGEYFLPWDGTDEAGRQVSSGIFIYQLRSEAKVATGKMILLK